MFAALYLPAFELQAALRPTPEFHQLPVALLEHEEAQATIFQVTPSAAAAGVHPGMTPSQGLARCLSLLIKSRVPAQEKTVSEILLHHAATLAPEIEATAPGICTVHFSSPKNYRENVESVVRQLAQLQLTAQAGLAATPDLSFLAAYLARPVLAVEQSAEFLAPLPLETLLHLSRPTSSAAEALLRATQLTHILTILRHWGLHSLGAFAALARDQVGARLGAEAVGLWDQATGKSTRLLRLVRPPELFAEEMEFEYEIETTEPLLFILRRFLEQLSQRLRLLYLVARELTLQLTFADKSSYQHQFQIPDPTHSVEILFRLLQTHLENFRAEHPIIAVSLATQPAKPARQQFDLFATPLRDPSRLHETLTRLTGWLGTDRVGRPVLEDSHRPDSFHLQPFVWKTAETLPNESAPKFGPALRRFRLPVSGREEAAVSARQGPYRSSGDWWDRENWARVEWDLELTEGTICRAQEQAGRWVLEGIYD